MMFHLQEYFIIHQLNVYWFMVALCYITVRKNMAWYSTNSDNELESSLASHPPLNLGAYFESVIFKPNRKIRLSQSTYKVTRYINFTPYVNSFRTFYHFLQACKEDTRNPLYVG